MSTISYLVVSLYFCNETITIVELVDKVVSAVERNESTLGIFLDLSKAFDTIDHDVYYYTN